MCRQKDGSNGPSKTGLRSEGLYEPAGANGFWRKNLPERHVRRLVFRKIQKNRKLKLGNVK